MIIATRFHDFSAGHRVMGHESKCRFLHGHNYRVHFTVRGVELDNLGRVMDFGAIKTTLCAWLEEQWDHRLIMWEKDPLAQDIYKIDPYSLALVPFNPTAENMAQYLLRVVGPRHLAGGGVELVRVQVDETRKCSATAELI